MLNKIKRVLKTTTSSKSYFEDIKLTKNLKAKKGSCSNGCNDGCDDGCGRSMCCGCC
jgi:hypothetical protein